MKKSLVFISYAVLLASLGVSQSCDNPQKAEGASLKGAYELVWQDEFEYTGLPDTNKWSYDTEGNEAGWGNKELQHYTEADSNNTWVNNGVLQIIALNENYKGKKFTSARLMSNAHWKYGKVEVSAKLPDARGTWAALWMMPGGWSFNDGNWPDVGEIDIMEHVGHDMGVIHASAHSKDYQWQKNTQKTAVIYVPDVCEKFNNYILEWSPEVMKAYVNDSLFFEYKNEGLGKSKWPYDKPFYLLMNIAVGGAWGNVKGIDVEAFPQVMEIDYVRVYQLKEISNPMN